MAKRFSLRQRSNFDLVKRVRMFKRTLKQWIFYAGIKFLKTHKLTDIEEKLLEDVTDFFVEYIDKVEEDKEFLTKVKLPPIKLPEKKK